MGGDLPRSQLQHLPREHCGSSGLGPRSARTRRRPRRPFPTTARETRPPRPTSPAAASLSSPSPTPVRLRAPRRRHLRRHPGAMDDPAGRRERGRVTLGAEPLLRSCTRGSRDHCGRRRTPPRPTQTRRTTSSASERPTPGPPMRQASPSSTAPPRSSLVTRSTSSTTPRPRPKRSTSTTRLYDSDAGQPVRGHLGHDVPDDAVHLRGHH